MSAKVYEDLMIMGFSFSQSKDITKFGDPAKLASASLFLPQNIIHLKAGIAYAIASINAYIIDENIDYMNDTEEERLASFIDMVFKVLNLNELNETMDKFNQEVVNKYFEIKDSKLVLK